MDLHQAKLIEVEKAETGSVSKIKLIINLFQYLSTKTLKIAIIGQMESLCALS